VVLEPEIARVAKHRLTQDPLGFLEGIVLFQALAQEVDHRRALSARLLLICQLL
jgi:hypothetical protein